MTASFVPSLYIRGIVSIAVLGFTCTLYQLGDISAMPAYPVKGTGLPTRSLSAVSSYFMNLPSAVAERSSYGLP